MFTGIVEELGTFLGRDGSRWRIAARTVLADVAEGDSIAVNGCCLTVVTWAVAGGEGPDGGWWEADVSDETLARTNLGRLTPGDRVNLERPVTMGTRLGGHLVLGHVDGVGEVVAPPPDLIVRIPTELVRYVVEKGSIAVDGISLTAFGLVDDTFSVAVIPHTAAVTTLGHVRVGSPVNIEVDVLAKHVERLALPYLAARPGGPTSS